MDIKQLNSSNIQAIIQLEKEHAPDRPHYAKYDEKALNFIFNNSQSCRAYGAFDSNELVAWGAYRTNWRDDNLTQDGTYEISSVVVNTNYRRQGIGKMLLNKIIEGIKKNQNFKNIYLTVSPLNLGALLLYLTNGFIVYDFKKDVYGPGADRIYLKL
jgi:ribosomal protein S18 acetylase RimI-like enzyme